MPRRVERREGEVRSAPQWFSRGVRDPCCSRGASTARGAEWFPRRAVGSITGRRSVAEGGGILVKALTKCGRVLGGYSIP